MRSRNRHRPIAAAAAILLCFLLPVAASAESVRSQATAAPTARAPGEPAPASATITADEARRIVEKYFKLPDGPGRLETHIGSQGGRQVWQFMYTIEHENGSTGYGVGSVDAVTGQIMDFNLSYPELRPIRTGPLGPGQPRWAAEKKAWALVEEMYPDMAASLRPVPDNLTGAYPYYFYFGLNDYDLHTFAWIQYEGGVPVPLRSIRVAVDKESLAYVSLITSLQQEVTFSPGSAKLSADEALSVFHGGLTPQLAYQSVPTSPILPYSSGSPTTQLKLVYQTTPLMLDAVTGKLVDQYGREITAAAPPEELGPLPEGVAVAPPSSLPLDEASATAFARALVNPPADAQVNVNFDMGPGSVDKDFYIHFWGGEKGSIAISLDRETGRVLHANRSAGGPMQPDPPTLTDEQKSQAQQAAIHTAQQFYSGLLSQVKITQQGDTIERLPQLRFFFQRYETDIPVSNQGISVTIDPQTMEWSNLSLSWTDAEALPDPSDALSLDEVRRRIMALAEPVLSYQAIQVLPGATYRPPDYSKPQEALLVYQLSPRQYDAPYVLLDAITGDPVTYGGSPRPSTEKADQLLAGTRAEGEMRYLLSRSLLSLESLDPEGRLSRFDALKILLNAPSGMGWYRSGEEPGLPFTDVTPESPMYELVVRAYRAGILNPAGNSAFAGDEPVTRAEFAVWMVRALDLGDLARSPLATTTGFRDMRRLTREQQNGVAFLEALGILKPGALFQGSAPLTQADAASWVVQMINQLQKP